MTRNIRLQVRAPAKPAPGAPCNGCGLCCAAETCPVARLLLWQLHGPCRALAWDREGSRYLCGLVVRPRAYLHWLPTWLEQAAGKGLSRRIGAGLGCDCHYREE